MTTTAGTNKDIELKCFLEDQMLFYTLKNWNKES